MLFQNKVQRYKNLLVSYRFFIPSHLPVPLLNHVLSPCPSPQFSHQNILWHIYSSLKLALASLLKIPFSKLFSESSMFSHLQYNSEYPFHLEDFLHLQIQNLEHHTIMNVTWIKQMKVVCLYLPVLEKKV